MQLEILADLSTELVDVWGRRREVVVQFELGQILQLILLGSGSSLGRRHKGSRWLEVGGGVRVEPFETLLRCFFSGLVDEGRLDIECHVVKLLAVN